MPGEMSRVVGLWKTAAGEKIGQSLADPAQYDNLFPGLKDAVKSQQYIQQQTKPIPAASAASVPVSFQSFFVLLMLSCYFVYYML